jgi:membrane associated rhomboid family serine protease
MALYDRDYMREDAPTFGERLREISAFHWFFWANIVVFVAQWFFAPDQSGPFIPAGGVSIDDLKEGRVWTPFTYMFVHGSVAHILLNMIMFWFAGKRVQDIYGQRHFVLIYVLSGLVGAALQLAVAVLPQQPDVYLLGASAAIMGLILAYAVAMPKEKIDVLLFFVIPVRFQLWGLAKFLFISNVVLASLALMKVLPEWLSGGGAPIAYLAHLGGVLAGWYYARLLGYGGQPAELRHPGSRTKLPRRPSYAQARRAFAVELDEEAIRRQNPRRDPVVDLMRDEVDPILDKITDQGIHSLTDEERRVLDRASRQISRQANR